jgi:hypothetical protein
MTSRRIRHGHGRTVLAVALALGLATPADAATELRRPADPTEVLTRLPAGGTRRDPQLAALLAAASARPGELAPALAVAHHHLAIGRASQDSRFMGYAQAALAPWWGLPEPPAPVRLVRADVLQHRHAFEAALVELDAVLDVDPREARAWLARAQILMVIGRPVEAEPACGHLPRLRQRLAGAVCRAGVLALTGRGEAARTLLAGALTAHPDAAPALRAWAYGAMAEIELGLGDKPAAGASLAAGRALAPGDAWLTLASADLALATGAPRDARALVAADPGHDGKLLRLALADRALGRDVGPLRSTLDDRFAAAGARGDAVTQREEARFRLELTGEPAAALAVAQANWRVQREVEDARLLLAAALAADRPDAARPVLDWIAATGLRDARLTPLLGRLKGARG